ncbi:MAG: MFS transporter [Sulfolobales archaeon]|nr:MFS transporter [Sulfolobales archaeon]MDW8082263.1 MFS transporter [Sulfolobales archaeon]
MRCYWLTESTTRNIVSTAVFNLFRGLAASGFNVLFAAYMSRLGYSIGEIGAVATVSNILGALLSPLVGYLLEIYSSRLITTLTGFMIGISLAIVAFSENIAALALSYSLFHLSIYFAQPARMVFLSKTIDRNKLGTVVGLTTSTFTVSRAIGPVLSGYLVVSFKYVYAFLSLSAIAIVGSLAFLLLSCEPDVERRPTVNSIADSYRRAITPSRELATLYLFTSLDRAAWNLWHPMLSAYLLDHGYSEVDVGMLVSLSNIVEAIGTPITGRLVDRLGSSIALALSEVTAALAAVLLVFPSTFPLCVASMLFIGVSISLWIPGYNVYVARVFRNIGEAFASINAVRSIVSIPSPYLGGLLYESVSSLAPFTLSTSMLFVATYIASNSLKRFEKLEER